MDRRITRHEHTRHHEIVARCPTLGSLSQRHDAPCRGDSGDPHPWVLQRASSAILARCHARPGGVGKEERGETRASRTRLSHTPQGRTGIDKRGVVDSPPSLRSLSGREFGPSCVIHPLLQVPCQEHPVCPPAASETSPRTPPLLRPIGSTFRPEEYDFRFYYYHGA